MAIKTINKFRSLFFIIALAFASSAPAAVWTEVQQWSPAFEDRFSEWVRTEWTADFFSRRQLPNGQSNPYYGFRADCADTVYSMRLIFAYENRLPFVINDPTASSRTISNQMSRWDRENEITRVRKFMLYLYDVVSTASLPLDTYPVAINRDAIRSGSLILTTRTNHHSWTVKEMLPIGVPHLVFNSVVGAHSGFGLQERKSWPNPEWVFEGNYTPAGHAGFRYWKPEAYLKTPIWQVPGYSEEQYRLPLGQWVRRVQARLALRQETDAQMVTRLIGTACEGLTGRVSSVNEGLTHLRNNPRCMAYPTYDNFSTPNRDQRIFDDLMALRRTYREILQMNGGNRLPADLIAKLNKIYPAINQTTAAETRSMTRQGVDANSVCVTAHLPGKSMDLAEFKRRMFSGLISNNPHDGAEYRWGDLRGPSELARRCQAWDAWTPDLGRD